jgi:predicted small secreted protein
VFKKIILPVALLAVLTAALAACNTIEGVGRDARAAGDAITGAAQKTKGY